MSKNQSNPDFQQNVLPLLPFTTICIIICIIYIIIIHFFLLYSTVISAVHNNRQNWQGRLISSLSPKVYLHKQMTHKSKINIVSNSK